jgi:hypothetical protein
VDVFLKKTAIGYVMFGEMDSLTKSYDYGDMTLVHMADIIRTKALASIFSNSS